MDKFTLITSEYSPKWIVLIYLPFISIFISGFFPIFSKGAIISIVVGFFGSIICLFLFFKNRKKLNNVNVEFKENGMHIETKWQKRPVIISWDSITRISFFYINESIKTRLGYNCSMRYKVLRLYYKKGKIWTWNKWTVTEEFKNKLREECKKRNLEFEESK